MNKKKRVPPKLVTIGVLIIGVLLASPVLLIIVLSEVLTFSVGWNNLVNKNLGNETEGKYYVTRSLKKNDFYFLRRYSDTGLSDLKPGEVLHVERATYRGSVENTTLQFQLDLPCDGTKGTLDIIPSDFSKKSSIFQTSMEEIPANQVNSYCLNLKSKL